MPDSLREMSRSAAPDTRWAGVASRGSRGASTDPSAGLLTVVLPAYNESSDLPGLLRDLADTLGSIDRPHRVLVVDDGSSDGTADVARDVSEGEWLDVIEHPENRGLGAALATGLHEAARRSEVVVTMDADASHDPSHISEMLTRLEAGSDVVIASRYRAGGRSRGVPSYRRLLSHGVRSLLGALAGVPGVRDYSSGYRAYRAEELRRAFAIHGRDGLVEESGFACMVEVLLKLAAQGVKVTEVPLDLRYDQKQGESKMRVVRTARRYMSVLTGRRRWTGR